MKEKASDIIKNVNEWTPRMQLAFKRGMSYMNLAYVLTDVFDWFIRDAESAFDEVRKGLRFQDKSEMTKFIERIRKDRQSLFNARWANYSIENKDLALQNSDYITEILKQLAARIDESEWDTVLELIKKTFPVKGDAAKALMIED